MFIDLSRYKVVHKDNVLRALGIVDIVFTDSPHLMPDPRNPRAPKAVMPETLVLAVINHNGNLVYMTTKAREVQFLPNLQITAEGPGNE